MRIHDITLQTDKLAEQRAFYVDVLGLPLLAEGDDSIALQAGATRLNFVQGAPACYHFAFNIPRNQFDEAKSWLEQRTALAVWDGQDEIHWKAWNAHAVYFYDPAGNIVEFIARHNLPNDSDVPFSGARLCEVSEIGLAAADVSQLARTLQEEAGIPVWDAGDGEVFTALGDDHGLFIIVRHGRPWFAGNGRVADFYPLRLVMQGSKAKTVPLNDLPYQIKLENKWSNHD